MSTAPSGNDRDRTMVLRDGRSLGWAEYGSPTGRALFYFHGHPGSRLEAAFLARQAHGAGVRLIGVDRPGMGLSGYQPGRRIADWPSDVAELADALGIETFAVVGFSGGGPYAAACARAILNRLTACGLAAGVGRTGPLLSFLASWVPWVMLPIIERSMKDENRVLKMLSGAAKRWVAPDRACFAQPEVGETMAASLAEAFRQGSRGPARDGTLIGRGWGFRPEEVTLPVHLWHGELDREVPAASARVTAARLAQCQAVFYPDEGHISLIANHGQEIVTALTC